MQGTSVKLYVYDLSGGLAASMSRALVGKQIDGIWHTGIVAFETEWYWSGIIQQSAPGCSGYGVPVHIIELGVTHMNREVFEDYISEIAHLYSYDSYDLLRNNCNNFTEKASVFLTGNSIPSFVSNLPEEVLSTPFGRMIEPMIAQWTNRMKQQSMMAQGMDPSNFPATQAAFTQQFFPSAAPIASTPSIPYTPIPPTTTNQPHRTIVTVSKEPSSITAAHQLRQHLYADQRPTNFDAIFKQLNFGLDTEHVIQELSNFFAMPNIKTAVLPPNTLNILLEAANTIDVTSGFALMFVMRLIVLSEQVNTAACADPRLIQILQRFLTPDTVPIQPRAMALLLLTNLFSTVQGEMLLLDSPHTTEWLGAELLSPVIQRRTPAAGLLYNFALTLSRHAKNGTATDHVDKFWQGATLISEVLLESLKNVASQLSNIEEEFLWRVCSALFYFVEADASAKEIAQQLDTKDHLIRIQSLTPGAKLSPLLKELIQLL